MKHIVDNVNKLELTFKTIDLEGRIPSTDAIEFLSVEEPYREGRRYSPFVRVRYALNGVKQDKAFPLDVDKGIFLSIDDDVLEEKLRPIAPKIVQILQEHVVQQNVEKIDSIKMTLKEHIDDIQKRLEKREYDPSEAAVRQGIIEPLLRALEWPTYDVKVVFPEYSVGRGNVDYALCHPAANPRAFIEVKRIGNIDKGTEQLFDYAFRKGVTILILTDGQKWRFYHPAGEGSYENRKVADLDFTVESSAACAKCLDRYLNYESVKIGKAAKVIAEDYRKVVSHRQIEERLPEVWSALVHEKNEYLILAFMDKAREKVGHEPTDEQVLNFLTSLQSKTKLPLGSGNQKIARTSFVVTMPDGEVIAHKQAKTTFAEAISKLGAEDVMPIKPNIVSTSQFPRGNVRDGQFHINTHFSNENKKRILEEIASDLNLSLKVEATAKK